MTLDDLPEFRAALKKFSEAGAEMIEVIERYQAHDHMPLDSTAVAYIIAGTDHARQALRQG